MSEQKEHKHGEEVHNAEEKSKAKRPLVKWLVGAGAALMAVALLLAGYVFAVSPAAIRNPKMDHFHFRMQILVDGKAVDFSSPAFQTPYAKGQCTADLSTEPFHFHDNKDQFVHVHWAGMTGGLLLKSYGWNFIGGKPGVLGYRTDNLPKLKAVPTHGNALPTIPEGTSFWVYTGDENSYQKKSFDDFKKQKLEQFFGRDSNFPASARTGGGVLDWFFPVAFAHDGEEHNTTLSASGETEQEQLTRINNLLGSVVIFVQKSEPTSDQVKARFADLQPLSASTCGG